MKAPLFRSIIILGFIIIGFGVVAASGALVWNIVMKQDVTADVTLPSVPEATLDAVRARQQTVQDINFDQVQTGVRRNPFTPY